MTKFISRDGKLYLQPDKGREYGVLRAWESYSGWYWFGVEVAEERSASDGTGSVMPDGSVVDDVIWFGYVQGGYDEEWGYFSQAELGSMPGKVWMIKEIDLPFAGRR